MAIGKFISYLRVSTAKQGASGLGLEAQRAAVLAYLNGGQWTLAAEYLEVESGAHNDRAQLAAAMAHCRLIGAKLVIAKLDRLSRNAAFLLSLRDAGVDFVAADMPDANKLTVGIMAVVAEAERDMISARTKAAMTAAKARGKTFGGFRGVVNCDHVAATAGKVAAANSFAADVQPTIKALQAGGRSLNAIAAELNARGILTRQGGAWTATAVSRILKRA